MTHKTVLGKYFIGEIYNVPNEHKTFLEVNLCNKQVMFNNFITGTTGRYKYIKYWKIKDDIVFYNQ